MNKELAEKFLNMAMNCYRTDNAPEAVEARAMHKTMVETCRLNVKDKILPAVAASIIASKGKDKP